MKALYDVWYSRQLQACLLRLWPDLHLWRIRYGYNIIAAAAATGMASLFVRADFVLLAEEWHMDNDKIENGIFLSFEEITFYQKVI